MEDIQRPRFSLHSRILIGFGVGALVGIAAKQLTESGTLSPQHLDALIDNVTAPIGRVFLNLLFMVVVPIVFCSIALGVSQLGAGKQLGRLTVRTFGAFIATSTIAALLGLALVNAFTPGAGFDPGDQAGLLERYGDEAQQKQALAAEERFWPDVVVGIVSRNPLRDAVEVNMLPVIFVAILFGAALSQLPAQQSKPVNQVLEGVASATVVIVGWAMRLAPWAVPALIFDVTARFGWQIFEQLSMFVIVVIVGYLIQLFVVNGMFVRFFAGRRPVAFFRTMTPVLITALSTSSS